MDNKIDDYDIGYVSRAGLDPEIRAYMQRMEAESQKRTKYARGAFIVSIITAIAMVSILITMLIIVRKVMPTVEDSLEQLGRVMSNIETVTNEISEANIPQMLKKTDKLIQSSQKGMEQLIDKVEAFDIEGLNESINDLRTVVEPLAKLFGKK